MSDPALAPSKPHKTRRSRRWLLVLVELVLILGSMAAAGYLGFRALEKGLTTPVRPTVTAPAPASSTP